MDKYRKISKSELIAKSAKGGLKADNFIIKYNLYGNYFHWANAYPNSSIHHIYYKDEKDAFEITAKSLFEEEFNYNLIGKVDKDFNLLMFKYIKDNFEIRNNGSTIDLMICGVLNLRTLDVSIVDEYQFHHSP